MNEPDETTRIGWMQARVLNRVQARIQIACSLRRHLIALELIELREELRADMGLAREAAHETMK